MVFFPFFDCAIYMSGQQTKWSCCLWKTFLLREKGKKVMWRKGMNGGGEEKQERKDKRMKKSEFHYWFLFNGINSSVFSFIFILCTRGNALI